jgi:2-aminobenzoate-CoA ligase
LRGSTLRKCVSAGEALPAATRALWKEATGIEMIDGIGATELMHIFISADEKEALPGATGKVVPGYVACIMDDDGKPAKTGEIGKLAVKGPTGCRYLADERQASYVKNGWNYTGDAYALDAEGYYHYHSRTDDMIISAGYNIAGPEVEDALLRHPKVAECGVIGVPDEERGQVVKAIVVLRPGNEPTPAMAKELQDYVKQSIAPYKYPRQVEFVASLPRTETGKLQRFRLRQATSRRNQVNWQRPLAGRLPPGWPLAKLRRLCTWRQGLQARAGRWCSSPARSAGTKNASFPATTSSPRPSRR